MQTRQVADILIEALPFILRFRGQSMVIKIGGSIMDKPELQKSLMKDIVLMKMIGINPVVVHGGGKHISNLMTRLGKRAQFVDGLRVTDKETMDLTQMVLAGLINKDIVSMINAEGGKAVGISGKDANLILGKKISNQSVDYGHVGEIETIDTSIIVHLEKNAFIPVVSPVAADKDGQSLNINGDVAATAIATALGAQKLIFLTDVAGVLGDIDQADSLITEIHVADMKRLKSEKIISGGMIPKLDSAARAIEQGIESIHILSGLISHSILLELFTDKGVGTKISA